MMQRDTINQIRDLHNEFFTDPDMTVDQAQAAVRGHHRERAEISIADERQDGAAGSFMSRPRRLIRGAGRDGMATCPTR